MTLNPDHSSLSHLVFFPPVASCRLSLAETVHEWALGLCSYVVRLFIACSVGRIELSHIRYGLTGARGWL
jgi:hypothetical protein